MQRLPNTYWKCGICNAQALDWQLYHRSNSPFSCFRQLKQHLKSWNQTFPYPSLESLENHLLHTWPLQTRNSDYLPKPCWQRNGWPSQAVPARGKSQHKASTLAARSVCKTERKLTWRNTFQHTAATTLRKTIPAGYRKGQPGLLCLASHFTASNKRRDTE